MVSVFVFGECSVEYDASAFCERCFCGFGELFVAPAFLVSGFDLAELFCFDSVEPGLTGHFLRDGGFECAGVTVHHGD